MRETFRGDGLRYFAILAILLGGCSHPDYTASGLEVHCTQTCPPERDVRAVIASAREFWANVPAGACGVTSTTWPVGAWVDFWTRPLPQGADGYSVPRTEFIAIRNAPGWQTVLSYEIAMVVLKARGGFESEAADTFQCLRTLNHE